MVATSCDLNAPRCTTKVLQVRLHGSREVSSLVTDPPRTPVTPCRAIVYYTKIKAQARSLTSVQTFHTHTHTLAQNGLFEFRCEVHLTCKKTQQHKITEDHVRR